MRLALFALVFFGLLQWAFHRELRPLLPRLLGRGLPWIQAVLHLPLLAYVGLRLSGLGNRAILEFLRPGSRVALYLQMVALVFLAWMLLAKALFRFRHGPETEPESPGRRAFLRNSALMSAGAAAASGGLGAVEAYSDPLVTRLSLPLAGLPQGLEGLRIAYLSDMHAGPLVGEAQLRRWRELAERERPELLLFGGDFVDSRPEEIPLFVEAFRTFRAPLGSFAILGNHDYFQDPGPIWAALEAMGVRCLENAHAVLERGGSHLALVGLQDPMALNGRFEGIRFGPGPQVAKAVEGLGPEPFRLGLIHAPSQWARARRAGAQLTLAGHTHGGQINLVPGLSSARFLGPYTAGLYEKDGAKLYVSRGLGVVGLPMRIAAPPELLILTLVRAPIDRSSA
ncbi:MAG TPA: metallophosphoesterase [Holophagaceae bacterium]|nr:metallophosphoesterase [Holophagaceae bacterium]